MYSNKKKWVIGGIISVSILAVVAIPIILFFMPYTSLAINPSYKEYELGADPVVLTKAEFVKANHYPDLVITGDLVTRPDKYTYNKETGVVTNINSNILGKGTYDLIAETSHETQELKLNVIDTTPPEWVDFRVTMFIPEGTSEQELLKYFDISDWDGTARYGLLLNDYNSTKAGKYNLSVIAWDSSGNSTPVDTIILQILTSKQAQRYKNELAKPYSNGEKGIIIKDKEELKDIVEQVQEQKVKEENNREKVKKEVTTAKKKSVKEILDDIVKQDEKEDKVVIEKSTKKADRVSKPEQSKDKDKDKDTSSSTKTTESKNNKTSSKKKKTTESSKTNKDTSSKTEDKKETPSTTTANTTTTKPSTTQQSSSTNTTNKPSTTTNKTKPATTTPKLSAQEQALASIPYGVLSDANKLVLLQNNSAVAQDFSGVNYQTNNGIAGFKYNEVLYRYSAQNNGLALVVKSKVNGQDVYMCTRAQDRGLTNPPISLDVYVSFYTPTSRVSSDMINYIKTIFGSFADGKGGTALILEYDNSAKDVNKYANETCMLACGTYQYIYGFNSMTKKYEHRFSFTKINFQTDAGNFSFGVDGLTGDAEYWDWYNSNSANQKFKFDL